MITIRLLLMAAVSMSAIVYIQAQVYSPTAVAGVDITLKPGLNLIHNPLDAWSTGNRISNLLAGLPDGTCVYAFSPGIGFIVNDYTTLFGWSNPNMSLVPGEGVFLYLPSGPDITLVFIGEVPQGDLKIDLVEGFNLVGSKVPQAGKITTDLGYTPVDGDLVYIYSNASGFAVYEYDDIWSPSEPILAVGQGLWIRKASAGTWSRTFSVD